MTDTPTCDAHGDSIPPGDYTLSADADPVDPVRMAHIWYSELARKNTPKAQARRELIGAVLKLIDDRNDTIRRLNHRAQEAESALTAVTKAVGEWKVDENKTYVPLGSLRKIAAAVGTEIRNRRWELHVHRMRRLQNRLTHFEEKMPSGQDGAPEDYDAWLRELIPDDRRLAFYQWVGALAVREALAEVRLGLHNDPVPPENRSYSQDSVEELLEVSDPDQGADPFPVHLPLGHPFCDVQHHVHTHGGSRLPTCRLDSPE